MRKGSMPLAALLVAAAFAAGPAAAQDYPKKQIELVVPFVAGGTTDNVARLIAQRFAESWGQTVIVNNRPGGGSTIGHALVAKAEMLIRKPVASVFEAFVDPAITTKFWFTKSSGKLEPGKEIRWDWEMYGVSTQVSVKAIEPL